MFSGDNFVTSQLLFVIYAGITDVVLLSNLGEYCCPEDRQHLKSEHVK